MIRKILTVVCILLLLLVLPYSCLRKKTTVVPEVIQEEYSYLESIPREVCSNRSFLYSRRWIGIDTEGWSVTPYLEIVNLENEAGLFLINFSLFDSSVYPYEQYKGREYEEFKDTVSRDEAHMQSPTVHVWLQPYEPQTVSVETIKNNPTSLYWALGNVFPPTLTECSVTFTYVNRTGTRNRTVYREISQQSFRLPDWILLLCLVIILVLVVLLAREHLSGRRRFS